MSLTKRFHITSLIAGLALVGALGATWVPAPTAHADGLDPDGCTEANVGEIAWISIEPCAHNVPGWRPFVCTEINGHYFWQKGVSQCGDVIGPVFL